VAYRRKKMYTKQNQKGESHLTIDVYEKFRDEDPGIVIEVEVKDDETVLQIRDKYGNVHTYTLW